MARRAVIHGIGHSVPDKVLTNADLERMVETNDEWIVQRTGIKERRVCREDETTGTLATAASRQALENAGVSAEEVDVIVCGTCTPDMPIPATACLIQDAIGARSAAAFDLNAACPGFIYSAAVGASMLESGLFRTALVIGADALTKHVDYTDRSTCVLFGDAAGAVVMRSEENTDRGLISSVLLSDGSGAKHINVEAGGTRFPMQHACHHNARNTVYMNGSEVYRFAVTAMGDACCKVLDLAGMTPDDIDLFVPHQANIRIIESGAKRLNLPPEKVFINIEKYGNTSGGSVPLALYEAWETGRIREGSVVLTVAFGAGLVWGANLIRW
ncbi:MAG: beta-ketoacyl-ACP synthase III [Fimbriimonadaceae bacterium]